MGLAWRGRKAEGIKRKMKPARPEGRGIPPGHRRWCQHIWVPRDAAGPEVGIGVDTLRVSQPRGGAPGGREQPYLSRRSPDGQLGGGGGGVPNLLGSPFSRPALGVGGRASGRRAPRTGRTCGTRGPGCLRILSLREGRLFRGWDGCGRRDASVPANS